MDPQVISQLIAERKWVLLSALVIGFVVRLLKSDTKIPIDIPSKYRVWLALALGLVSGVLEKAAVGLSWKDAILNGLAAWVIAVLGHNTVVESLRGGKEINVPGLVKPGVPPSPGKPPSVPPLAGGLLLALLLSGCLPAKDVKPVTLSVVQTACVILNAFVPNQSTIMKACNIAEQYGPVVADLLAAQRKAAAQKAALEGKAGAVTGDKPVACVVDDQLAACAP